MFKVGSAGIRKQLKWSRRSAHTHISFSIANLTEQLVLYQNEIQWDKHQRARLCVTIGIRCSSAGGYQTALHCCGRPLLDWGWIACIRRNASCTEPRCPYRDGSVRIHVPCHPYCICKLANTGHKYIKAELYKSTLFRRFLIFFFSFFKNH